MRLPSGLSLDRRTALTSVLLAGASSPPLLAPPPAFAAAELPSSRLLSLVPEMPFGAPATNATLPAALVQQIEDEAHALERLGTTKDLSSKSIASLDGSWRLLYSNAREITNLASGLPLGFALGTTYQPVDVATGRFENQGLVEHVYGLARASTLVVGDVVPAPLGTLNAAGTLNRDNNRVDITFRRISFNLDEFLGKPVSNVRKVLSPAQKVGAAQPANDITYLDGTMRVTRGGEDSLFIFRREASPRPMLTVAEREQLYRESGAQAVETGNNSQGEGGPPELRKLLKQ